MTVAVWPRGDPREVAGAILRDARYRAASQGPAPKSWWDVVWDTIREWWTRLTKPLGQVLGNDTVSTTIGVIVLVVALAFLAYVVYRFARPFLAQRRRESNVAQSTLLEGGDDARSLRERGLAAAAQGRYHEAAALLWASALHALDEIGRVQYDAARTPGEWRRAVRDPAFDALARDAVIALFGDREPDAALVARMRTAYDAVVSSS